MDGFILIDKPEGPSSHFVVNRLRKILKIKKTGHAGTLDPMASGLLVCAAGKATRLIQYLDLEPKVYHFQIDFSKSTDTLDREGSPVRSGGHIPSIEDIHNVLPEFTGEIMQIPPRFSALKINGTPAYKLARKGIEVNLQKRRIAVNNLELMDYNKNELTADFSVSCTTGTYIRSLVRDICSELGCYGHTSRILRKSAGYFDLKDSVPFQSIKTVSDIDIISVYNVFSGNNLIITASEKQKDELSYGRNISVENQNENNSPVFISDNNKNIIAAGNIIQPGIFHPEKVFIGK